MLYQARCIDEALVEADALSKAPNVSPDGLIIVGAVMYQCTALLDNDQQRLILGRARKLLQNTLSNHISNLNNTDAAYAYAILGLCLERLNRTKEALDAYNQALKIEPRNDVALVRRGFLRQQTDPHAAAVDFEKSIEDTTVSALPYRFLARNAIKSGNWTRALELSESLIRRAVQEEPKAFAAAWEFIAIARHGLNEPWEWVEQAFQKAVHYDPTNARIIENFRIFEESLQTNPPPSPLQFHAGDIPVSPRQEYPPLRWPLALAA